MSGITQALIAGYRDPIEMNFIGTAVSGANASSYTFSNQSIGTATDDRLVFVAVQSNTTTSGLSITSVTVGGVSATQLNFAGTNSEIVTHFIAQVPTGNTANIVVTCSGTYENCGIGVWTLKNASGYSFTALPNASGSGTTASSVTFTFPTVKKNDVIIATARIRSANVGTYSSTNATERFDMVVEATFSGQFGADNVVSTAGTNYQVVISTTGASPSWGAAATRIYLP